jgi:hypothetical protein
MDMDLRADSRKEGGIQSPANNIDIGENRKPKIDFINLKIHGGYIETHSFDVSVPWWATIMVACVGS